MKLHGAFYILPIGSGSVGARPGSPNLAGLGSYIPGSLGPAYLVLPSFGHIQLHVCTIPVHFLPRLKPKLMLILFAQIRKPLVRSPSQKIAPPPRNLGSTIPIQPASAFCRQSSVCRERSSSLYKCISDFYTRRRTRIGRTNLSCRFSQYIPDLSHIFADKCEYLHADMEFSLKLAKRCRLQTIEKSSGSSTTEY